VARPLSEDRRNAILEAAMALIAEEGLGASTADIARKAGVPNGSVFTYFETKAELLNALYVGIKKDLIELVHAGMPGPRDPKAQLRHLWNVWIRWGLDHPDQRRALAQLSVSDQITGASVQATIKLAAPTLEVIEQVTAEGALRDAPPRYVQALVEATVNTTMDFISSHPKDSKKLSQAGFEALWKMLN
jgi:AcrR family transcriptional regulator